MTGSAALTRLSIVVVTYNSAEIIEGTLAPFVPALSDGLEIIVIDNASADGTVARVRAIDARIDVIAGDTNLGFARAVNTAVAAASGAYVCLLNPDCATTVESIAALVERLDAHPEAGIVGPAIEQGHGDLVIASAGHDPTLWRMAAHWSGLARLAGPRWLEGHYLMHRAIAGLREVDWITGALMIIRREAWDAVGGMTERWFMYAEDLELCWRFRSAGWSVLFDPDQRAAHAVGGSASERPREIRSAWIENLYDFYQWRLNPSRSAGWAWKAISAAGLGLRAAVIGARARVGTHDAAARKRSRDLWLNATDLLRA